MLTRLDVRAHECAYSEYTLCRVAATKTARTLVMVRHGSSEWSDDNRFTSWYDSPLSDGGRQGARRAGEKLQDAGYQFDVAFASVLSRAKDTLRVILEVLGQPGLPVHTSWRLNERHYGALVGMNRAEAAAIYGEQQVREWRRGYDAVPPPMPPDHPHHDAIVSSPIYVDGPPPEQFPDAESLEMTIARTLPFWSEEVLPRLEAGDRVLVCAHGNTIRGLVKIISRVPDGEISKLTIPMAIPLVYELDERAEPVRPMRFLADDETVRAAVQAIDAQIKPPE